MGAYRETECVFAGLNAFGCTVLQAWLQFYATSRRVFLILMYNPNAPLLSIAELFDPAEAPEVTAQGTAVVGSR